MVDLETIRHYSHRVVCSFVFVVLSKAFLLDRIKSNGFKYFLNWSTSIQGGFSCLKGNLELIKVNLVLTVLIIFHVQETTILNRERGGVDLTLYIDNIIARETFSVS